jgi:hypothetical protein
MYPIGSAIMRALVMRVAPIRRSPREGLVCRSASLVPAIVARAWVRYNRRGNRVTMCKRRVQPEGRSN